MHDSESTRPSDLTPPDATYWRKKLNAFLHDNPDKALDVGQHELKQFLLSRIDQFQPSEAFNKQADFHAAAADRLPFPHHGQMRARFDGFEHPFFHPLGGKDGEPLPIRAPRTLNKELAFETSADSRPYLDQSDPRSDFIVRWRFWRQWATESNAAFAYLPADTRIPDHSIWNHMALTSAFQGCFEMDSSESPASSTSLLLFSIGPVQPLIAAARNFRDLWSGSFLLSYLIAEGMGVICKHLGPDHVLFPSIWGVPLIDLMLKDIYQSTKVRQDLQKTLWDQIWVNNSRNRQWYLQPNLPNRFLALVPTSQAKAIAQAVEARIQEKLQTIGNDVIRHLDLKLEKRLNPKDSAGQSWFPKRIAPQLKNAIESQWQTFEIPKTIEASVELARSLLPKENDGAPTASLASIERLKKMWESLPSKHHTSYGLLTPTSAWPILYDLTSWLHDGVKRTRAFAAFPQDDPSEIESRIGRKFAKDSLTGKETVVLQAPSESESCQKLSREISGGQNSLLLKAGETLGALTLVKRFWHLSYLPKFGFVPNEDLRMPDLHQMAKGDAYSEEEELENEARESDSYIAVLALDGDEMGKWVSGAKTPQVRNQLAKEARVYFEVLPQGSDSSNSAIEDFLSSSRPLNPSFHLQFSEALANFGLYTVRRIVEAHRGRLVYCGGDDVLAVMPASQSLRCSAALRGAFQGHSETLNSVKGLFDGKEFSPDIPLFQSTQEGTVRLHPKLTGEGGRLRQESPGADFLMPGPNTTCSVGIAVAHYKSPLQDVVRAAQAAEKMAKQSPLCRNAIAVTILKRSGEIQEWGSKWESKGLELLESIIECMRSKKLSFKFPHRVCELLEPYRTDRPEQQHPSFDAIEIVWAEFSHALQRQCQPPNRTTADELIARFKPTVISYLNAVQGNQKDSNLAIEAMIGLCKTAAFFQRISA